MTAAVFAALVLPKGEGWGGFAVLVANVALFAVPAWYEWRDWRLDMDMDRAGRTVDHVHRCEACEVGLPCATYDRMTRHLWDIEDEGAL